MPLVLYNSLTRRKERFQPLDPSRVGMYVCGPTVYDFAHLGNARAVVAFDLLYRVLRHEYGAGQVRYVRNITDVEDKIIAAARENGEPIDALTERTIAIFREDMAALGNLPPDVEPRATQYIPQMIALVERLIASGHAYAAEGHALFRVGSYAKYGALSRRSRADMIAGARVEVAPYKEDPGDFVLWKPSTADQPGWPSPWGRGRPGWHIECSAMSEGELGETFDIHGGGLDLVFPHHENEIAQSVCAHDGRPFARIWLHNGMLTVGGTKMAKSEGNFTTVREALADAPGEVIRLALLSTHYRDPFDWTPDRLHQARQILDRWYRALDGAPPASGDVDPAVMEALNDDLNVPLAIARLHEIAAALFQRADSVEYARLRGALIASGHLLGLLRHEPDKWFRGPIRAQLNVTPEPLTLSATATVSTPAESVGESLNLRDQFDATVTNPRIDALIAERAAARKERRFADADAIRAALAAEGIVLEDRSDGTTDWRRA
jgi:cysteinyl-tRNA synthetase